MNCQNKINPIMYCNLTSKFGNGYCKLQVIHIYINIPIYVKMKKITFWLIMKMNSYLAGILKRDERNLINYENPRSKNIAYDCFD